MYGISECFHMLEFIMCIAHVYMSNSICIGAFIYKVLIARFVNFFIRLYMVRL